jgi:tRNA modification GTPase
LESAAAGENGTDSETYAGSGSSADEEARGALPSRPEACEALRRLNALALHWQRERIYTEGALVVIAGKPNAGKSSLFNYIIREDRSIVTTQPGTTRDWIEAGISVKGIPVRLADTAGLRDTAEASEAEALGIKRSEELLQNADAVLYVVDGALGITNEDTDFFTRHAKASIETSINPETQNAAPKPLLVVWNKADLATPQYNLATNFPQSPFALFAASAKTGEGIAQLMDGVHKLLSQDVANIVAKNSFATNVVANIVAKNLNENISYNEIAPGTLRQKELLDCALASVAKALELADCNEPLDIIAPLFRAAINELGEITGETASADIFEAMFSRFCVGK